MRARPCALAVALLTVPWSAAAAEQRAPEDGVVEQALLDFERGWLDAQRRRDAGFFERILDEQLSQVSFTGDTADRKAFFDFFRGGDWEYLAARLEEADARVLGDTAVTSGRVFRRVRVGQRVTEGSFRFTHVWRKRNDGWRVVHSHQTEIAAAEASTRRTGAGIHVLYRFRVKAGEEARFREAWARVTEAAVARAGARGSLLAGTDQPDVFIAIARWSSREEWKAYRSRPPLDPAALGEMLSVSELLSFEVFEDALDVGRP